MAPLNLARAGIKSIPYNQRIWIGALGGPSVWLTISNESIVSFHARLNYGEQKRYEKKKGNKEEDKLTLIYNGQRRIYFFDIFSAPHGYVPLQLQADD